MIVNLVEQRSTMKQVLTKTPLAALMPKTMHPLKEFWMFRSFLYSVFLTSITLCFHSSKYGSDKFFCLTTFTEQLLIIFEQPGSRIAGSEIGPKRWEWKLHYCTANIVIFVLQCSLWTTFNFFVEHDKSRHLCVCLVKAQEHAAQLQCRNSLQVFRGGQTCTTWAQYDIFFIGWNFPITSETIRRAHMFVQPSNKKQKCI